MPIFAPDTHTLTHITHTLDMKTFLLTTLIALIAMPAAADDLQGFAYGNATAPTGHEWQSPQQLSLNKEQPRAYTFPFADADEAASVLPYGSTYYQSLDGTWKFQWVPTPSQRDSTFHEPSFDTSAWDDIQVPGCWNVQGLQEDGTMRYGVPIYVNQPVIFYHEVRKDDWRQGVMRTPPTRWTTYGHRNEVGSYRRTFTLPASWDGRHVYINFDGVDSFFYLWINGHYVGFSKNSRNTARFDITPYLDRKAEEQVVAVAVYRSSDGSFLEAQDMFRLPGIFRSTYLTASPQLQIRDLAVRTHSIGADEALIDVDIDVRNLGKKKNPTYKVSYQVLPVELYSDVTQPAVTSLEDAPAHTRIHIPQPRLWSAEEPNRYVLVATLTDKKGRLIDCTSTYFGVRTVEIRDTPAEEDEFHLAGRYFYVNGKPVKLKGVNRHENNPSTGHAISHAQMQHEVMLMKQANINHVRLSHYSNDPFWYYLSDKYGLYLEDEANIESHEYYYGEASLSHPTEWTAAHVARNMEMVHSHVNHPSIVIWSLGNEAGPGDNFVQAIKAIKAFDTSRPVQYERDTDNGWRNVDLGSNQYPSVAWVQNVAKGNSRVKYPFHISEYAHSMGNSLGNYADFWAAMESTNHFIGGAIWDWVDQAIDAYTPDGIRYLGYGGDHGDWPNDGMFCMNGIMLPDLTPKPQYYEVKKVNQYVGVTLADSVAGVLEVFNKNYFLPLDYDVTYQVRQDGTLLYEGTLDGLQGLGPRQRRQVSVPLTFRDDATWDNVTLDVLFRLPTDMPWASAGYVQAQEQFLFRRPASQCPYPTIAQAGQEGTTLLLTPTPDSITVTGQDFSVTFDNADGWISSLEYDGLPMFTDGPRLDAFRAPVDNDNWAWNAWFQNGLHQLRHHTTQPPHVERLADGSVSLTYNIRSQATHEGQVRQRPGKAGQPFQSIEDGEPIDSTGFHFTTAMRYVVHPDGSIALAAHIVTSKPSVALPRLGFAMLLPPDLDQYTYYGRGPLNNYSDRKTGSFYGLWHSTVAEQFVPFPKPQSMGNREDVSWCALTDADGTGIQFVSQDQPLSASALPWSALQLTLAAHPHELPESDGTHLHLDCKVNGLGGNSCGQGGPLDKDRVKGRDHTMSFVIRPLRGGDDMVQRSHVLTATQAPQPVINEPEGDKGLPLEVIFVSSEEGPHGEVAGNLLDGDEETIWHTMYSITMGTYPHWIDFDCKEVKSVKGFTYLPRQSGTNGDIKGYRLELSLDGETWTEAAQGEFPGGKKEKKVLFPKPQKARYVRFTALSSQHGDVFASGAEFSVLAE